MTYLGTTRLEAYRQRLHTWAEGYIQQGWPIGTPEYLLRGYYRMLQATGDLDRMIACATDAARHDRMLDLTGGDVAALAEVHTALDLIAAHDDPDLVTALRLAHHRDQLTDRNGNIPTDLPAVWASLGQHTALKPSPPPSSTRSGSNSPWPGWREHWPRSARPRRPPRSPGRPGLWPTRSPTSTGRGWT